jgi:hypothetical protein
VQWFLAVRILAGAGGLGAGLLRAACWIQILLIQQMEFVGATESAAHLDYDENKKKYPTLEKFYCRNWNLSAVLSKITTTTMSFLEKFRRSSRTGEDIGYDLVCTNRLDGSSLDPPWLHTKI